MLSITPIVNLKNSYNQFSTQVISFCGKPPVEKKTEQDVFIHSVKVKKREINSLNKQIAQFPQDVAYKKAMLINMGENPKNL